VNILEAARSAFDGIAANKMRAVLTTLGVIIGVAAVISLVSISEGSIRQITAQIEEMGTDLITIHSGGMTFTVEDAAELERRVPTLKAVVPHLETSSTIKWGLTNYHTQIAGVGPAYLEVRNYKLSWGRFISETDVQFNRPVAVISETVVQELFRGRDPLGETVTLHGQQFTVVGVLEDKGGMFGYYPRNLAMIPITTAQRVLRMGWIHMLYGQLTDREASAQTVQHIQAIFSHRSGGREMVYVESQEEMLKRIAEAHRTGTLMLAAIASIALLVGGIGIMNIMLVSVTERTREIGLRKALGAKRRSILGQFLIEAVLISMAGGALGVWAGYGVSRLISKFSELQTAVSVSSVILSFSFAAAVGIIFGVYPAIKAARLAPIAALRYE